MREKKEKQEETVTRIQHGERQDKRVRVRKIKKRGDGGERGGRED